MFCYETLFGYMVDVMILRCNDDSYHYSPKIQFPNPATLLLNDNGVVCDQAVRQ